MAAIIFLIFLGIIVAGGFLAAFIWAVRSGQYDDDYSPSVRMLFDKKEKAAEEKTKEETQSTTITKN
ncbi:MAG: cbb3-type cytochrome oxidase assembly protein CcoS [Bacteroidales bacterium]|nr:cbb3-type cytochrome oxidase assembly protein CcoS [Bacteroidales bacterium]